MPLSPAKNTARPPSNKTAPSVRTRWPSKSPCNATSPAEPAISNSSKLNNNFSPPKTPSSRPSSTNSSPSSNSTAASAAAGPTKNPNQSSRRREPRPAPRRVNEKETPDFCLEDRSQMLEHQLLQKEFLRRRRIVSASRLRRSAREDAGTPSNLRPAPKNKVF